MKIFLPRIYCKGPPPTMIINSKVKSLVGIEKIIIRDINMILRKMN